MSFYEIVRLFNTIKFLKVKQIFYRLYYAARRRAEIVNGFKYALIKKSTSFPLALDKSIQNIYSTYNNRTFNLLNLSKLFDTNIDWNYSSHGKLWTYNLTYFEYLHDKKDIGLLYDFIENIDGIKDGLEPFPISLRGINWIKFLTYNSIRDNKIDDSLYAQYYILQDNLEYHLLGNHLLENAFSMLFGAYYFQDEVLYRNAKKILMAELKEQILNDGGHFELSPMYHQIMLFRVLDCINLVKNNSWKEQELLMLLQSKAETMLGWLRVINYKDGNIPLLNDSAYKIAPTSNELFEYANNLSIKVKNTVLKDSGYRKISYDNYECIVDIGSIGADYIPGHAHADTFSFEVRIKGEPFIVDTGLSTYEVNDRRSKERGTASHNTVEIIDKDSSEVWRGFRVANRANIIEIEEKENYIKATHSGYKKIGVFHTREWRFCRDKIIIEDTLKKETDAIMRVHFHPSINNNIIEERIKMQNANFTIKNYKYAPEFNTLVDAKLIEVVFTKNCKVEIRI